VPSTRQAVRVSTLVRASELTGDDANLATFLGIAPRTLEAMLAGLAVVPDETFLRAVDLVSARQLTDLLNSNGNRTDTEQAIKRSQD
jgi:hypothetical protein